MDTPSKERLVGAIIFVVLIVLLVPEILSGPRRAVPASGSATNLSTRTYIVELGNPVKPAAAPASDAKPPALPAPTELAKSETPASTPASPASEPTPAPASARDS